MRRRDVFFLMLVYAALSVVCNFPSGFTNSSVNTAVAALDEFIGHSLSRRGWRVDASLLFLVRAAALNCWWLFQVFGALLSPVCLDRLGRRSSFILACVITLAATLLQWLAILHSLPEALILGRSLTALTSPLADACLILYIQETSPVRMRGTVSFFGEIGYGAMCVLGMVLGMRTVLGASLENLLLSSIPLEILSIAVVYALPETPKFLLITRDDRKAARASLEFFQGPAVDHEEVLDEMEQEKDMDDVPSSSYREVLTTWHLRRAVLVACCVLVLTLSFYPMLQSSTFFFLAIRIPEWLAEASSTALMLLFTLSCVLGSTFIDRFPRRTLILLFGCLTNVFLVIFSALCILAPLHPLLKYAALASLVAYCISFGMVLGPIAWFIAPELVSQRHRATVFSLCFAIGNALITATNFAIIPLFRVLGGWSFVLLFVLPSLCSLLFLWDALPESVGLQSHEVVAAICASRRTTQEEEDDEREHLVHSRY